MANRRDFVPPFCVCGCGTPVKKQGARYAHGHHLKAGLVPHFPMVRPEDRFWGKVNKTDGCWLWTGKRNALGYGLLRRGGKGNSYIRAHRLSYEIAFGAITDGRHVCHRCDNPSCVNPDHLFLGTVRDNMQDKARKGRAGRPNKMPEAKASAIRGAAASGLTQRQIARMHGVSQCTVSRVVNAA